MRFRTVILLALTVTSPLRVAHAQWRGPAPDAGRGLLAAPGEPSQNPDRPALYRSGRYRMAIGIHVPFGVRALATPSVTAGITRRRTSIDVGADHRSYDAYTSVRMHVALGRAMVERGSITTRLGVTVRIIHERLGLLGVRNAVESTLGLLLTHGSGFAVAAHTDPDGLMIDASWTPSSPWPMLVAGARLHPEYGWIQSSGLEWQLVDLVRFRAGYRNRPEALTVGLGIELPAGITIDWAVAAAAAPGWSSWLGIGWQS